jgi:hypothetical protein
MRTSNWTALTALALALTVPACGDNGGDDDTTTTTMTPMTSTTPMTMGTTTMEEPTTGIVDPSTDPTNDPSTTTTDPDPTTTTTPPDPTTETTNDDTTTGGGELTCEAYCDIYETACKDFSEYDNEAACLAQCSQWPVGDPAAIDGDSLGCRTYHVTVASGTEPNVHCPHAGPNGAGVCVSADPPLCADYCAVYFENCQDDLNLYNDMADCMAVCATWYPGVKGEVVGDTVGCREYHADAAFGDDVVHCPHAGPGGADVCVIQ